MNLFIKISNILFKFSLIGVSISNPNKYRHHLG